MKQFLNRLLPHFLILLGFFIASIVYNFPITQDKALRQNDVVQHESASQELIEYKKETGRYALWTNALFGGMPAFMVYLDYPNSITTKLGRALSYLVPEPANLFFLKMFGFYLMLVMLGYNPWIGIFGAVGFTFSSYHALNIEAGHISKVLAMAFAPPFIGAVILTYRGKYLLGGSLAALFAGIELYANHVQVTYYILIALVFYVLFELGQILLNPEDRAVRLKQFAMATGVLVFSGMLSVGSHASRLMVLYDYSQETIRGGSELKSNVQSTSGGLDRNYAFDWSYGISETFTLIIPNFYGGGSNSGETIGPESATGTTLQDYGLNPRVAASFPYYWGNLPFTGGPAYMGAIVCFFFVFGFLMSKSPIKWWLLTISILFLMLSWGKNLAWFNYTVFDTVPLYNKFRAVTMILTVLQLFAVWMGVLGLKELFSPDLDRDFAMRQLRISGGVVGGLVLFFALLGSSFLSFRATDMVEESADGEEKLINRDESFRSGLVQQLQNNEQIANEIMDAIEDDRANMMRSDAFRSFIFIALAVGVIWVFLIEKISLLMMVGLLSALTLIDLWSVSMRYLNEDDFVNDRRFEQRLRPNDANLQIMQDTVSHFRVVNLTLNPFNDGITSRFHHSIGGYHAAKLRRFNEFADNHLVKNNREAFNMLNTKYFITRGEAGYQARVNPAALGNAWFVEEVKVVPDADAEIEALNGLDPKKTVLVDERFASQLEGWKNQADPDAKINLVTYEPDRLVYSSDSKTEQVVVFSEIYYVQEGRSEWVFTVDGQEVPHFRCNYLLRGMRLPAGKHTIECRFVSPYFRLGQSITLICSILLVLFLGAAAYFSFKQLNVEDIQAEDAG